MARPDLSESGSGRVLSGRFRVSVSSAAPVTIATVGAPCVYRVHNAGKTAFQLNGHTEVLAPRGSVDHNVATTLQVTTTSATAIDVEGIYERLSPDREFRSGKIYVETSPANGTVIVHGRPGSLYRVMNSGRKMFRVVCGTTIEALPGRRSESRSVDIVNHSGDIVITDGNQAPNANSPYEGIFEDVNLCPVDRLGRFKIEGDASVANTERNLILVPNGGSIARDYRFVNTGRAMLEIWQVGGAKLFDVPAESSVDYHVTSSIKVRAALADTRIRGLYYTL